MSVLSRFFAATRPHNSLLPLLLVYLGGSLVHAEYHQIGAAMLFLFFAHGAVTVLNDVEDREIDDTNGRDNSIFAILSPSRLVGIAWLLLGVAVVASFLLLPPSAGMLLAGFVFFAWLYNAKPLQLSRRPMSSIALLGVCYAFIPLVFGLALGGEELSLLYVLLGASFAIGRVSLSMLKDYKDARGDALHHKKTFLLVYGRTAVRRVSVVLAVIGYAGVITCMWLVLKDFPPIYVVPITLLAGWLVYQRTRLSPDYSYEKLNGLFHDFLHYELLFYGYIVLWASILLI